MYSRSCVVVLALTVYASSLGWGRLYAEMLLWQRHGLVVELGVSGRSNRALEQLYNNINNMDQQ
jgi:hypothetical protein